MATTNLGRVQGGSTFLSTATSSTSVAKNTLTPTNIVPLVGDRVQFANGDVRIISAVATDDVTCGGVVANLTGPTGTGVGSNPNLLINSNFAINQRNGYIFRGTAPFYSDAGLTNQIGITDARVGYVTVESISGNAANITISYTPDNGSSWITRNGYVSLSSCTSGYVAAASGWTYTVDRWRISGSGSSYNVATNTVTLANSAFDQIIELPTYLKGKTVTASINVSSISGSFTLRTYDGTTTTTQTLANGTVSKTITIGNSATSLRVFVFGTGSFVPNWVKLEVGDVATEYTPPLIAEELTKCYRYYRKYLAGSTYGDYFGLGVAYWSTTRVFVPFKFTVQMRATPTFSWGGNWRLANSNINKTDITLTTDQQNREGCAISATSTSGGFTSGGVVMLSANNDYQAYIAFDAEL